MEKVAKRNLEMSPTLLGAKVGDTINDRYWEVAA
ncbi:MAG: hypothetical protein RLZZ298_1663 [Pseudomonadota bacterium]|jgi:hypothetical protein